ncbi:GIY-YIG nuclease family protein [Fredinandcohnia quinoae]|uniref:GIY-YIG nuclease family protein n=1 Tax=Fredinandcohnia quinoae TaxID=2918902 RepID=A0AAW5ECC4_9BACI|nr:GIY-YIG nuclease family protein [Fredinandcohnia sp. SECRCQ15]MCH1626424.1 GIY-YIG nuclease family protein [Fredinandcohnia sp. SECRCQ15]
MDRKKELKQMYKETPIEGGIFQIKNSMNGKLFIGSTKNFKTLNGLKFTLENGSHMNKKLQEEWSELGKNSFEIEILEVLKKKDNAYFDEKKELAKLEEKWLENLQPFGEHGYH